MTSAKWLRLVLGASVLVSVATAVEPDVPPRHRGLNRIADRTVEPVTRAPSAGPETPAKHPFPRLYRGQLLPRPPYPPPLARPAWGYLQVNVDVPEAKVFVNGRYWGEASPGQPVNIAYLPVGQVTVRVEAEGHEPSVQAVALTANRWTQTTVPLQSGARPPEDAQAAQPDLGLKDIWREVETEMAFVRLPEGCFQMGSPQGEPGRYPNERRHEVCVQGFWMGKYEVTNAQYRKFKANHDSRAYEGYSLDAAAQPVVQVSWHDARRFARWLSERTGKAFRLPTEAEWEYAARAQTTTAHYWGAHADEACGYANVADRTLARQWPGWTIHDCVDGYVVAAPIGQFRPNAFGLHDVLGNVWEWTCSAYMDGDNASEQRCATADDPSRRIMRGGSWQDPPDYVRAAERETWGPKSGADNLGFRLLFLED